MKLEKSEIIKILKDSGYIKDENDIADIKTDGLGNVFVKFNQSLEHCEIEVKVE